MTEVSSSALQGALDLRVRGLCFFPTRGKLPIIKDWQSRASNDEMQIRQWARENEGCNFGIALGRSGHVAFDLDIKNDVDGIKEFENLVEANNIELPPTLVVRTPSGGAHLIFKDSGQTRNSASKLAPGVDVRGDGGFIVAAGGEIDGERYKIVSQLEDWEEIPEAPPALLALASAKKNEPQLAPSDAAQDTPADIERARAWLAKRAPAVEGRGGDAWTVETGMMLRDMGVSESVAVELAEECFNPRCEPPWPSDELRQKFANSYMYAENPPGAKSVGDVAKVFSELNAKILQSGCAADAPQKVEASTRRFKLIQAHEFHTLREPSWLIQDILPEQSIAIWFGPSRSFKSFQMVDLLASVATGRPAFGKFATKQGGAIMCAAESPFGVARARFPAWASARGIEKTNDIPFAIVPSVPLASSAADFEELISEIKDIGFRPRIVCLDTAARSLAGLDENDAMAAGMLVGRAERLRDELGCAVLMCHHVGKNGDRGPRGSSALFSNVDTVWEVRRQGDGMAIELINKKQKDTDESDDVHLHADPHAGSLVMRWLDADAYASETLPNPPIAPAEVGRALKDAGATHGVTITTRCLAAQLAGPTGDEKAIKAAEKRLQRGAKSGTGLGPLAAYVVSGAGARGLRWTFPSTESDGGRDDY